MSTVFLQLLNMSITAGWLILAVLCIRRIFRKLPKWAACLLWAAPAFRLICPFSIESPFSLLPSTEPIKISTTLEGNTPNYIPSIDSRLTIVKNTINPMLSETFAYNKTEHTPPLQAAASITGLIWVCGMIVLFLYAAYSIIRLHMLVAEAVCVKDRIYICDPVKSPFILGIIRPKIYVSSALTEHEMRYILAHESAHLKRKDHWWKLLGYLLLCLYWFHPLCWAAYALFCRDIELACDEKTARQMTFAEKKEYSKVLLSCAGKKSLLMAYPLAFGEAGIKERVKSILNYKKPTLWIILTSAAVFVILAACFLTNPAKKDTGDILSSRQQPDYEASGKNSADSSQADDPLLNETDSFQADHRTQNETDSFQADDPAQTKTDSSQPDDPAQNKSDSPQADDPAQNKPDSPQADDPAQNKSDSSQADHPKEAAPENVSALYTQPKPGRVCIGVQPSMLREYHTYYYIPTGSEQKQLSAQLNALDFKAMPEDHSFNGHKETGWQIVYNDQTITCFEDGLLYCTSYDNKKGMMEFITEAPELCSYIQIMLAENIGYQAYDISNIKDIVSARLDVNSLSTGGKFYSQTITDTEILQKFEQWFQNAEYILGGADCGNQQACLELTLSDGEIVKLSMATDSCPNFCINGIAYDYRPVSNWDNREFFKCCSKLPWNTP